MNDEKKFSIAYKKAFQKIKWEKINTYSYPFTELISLFKKAKQSKNMKTKVRYLVDIFEIAEEFELYDKRCIYPGCGEEIEWLVVKYL